MSNPQPTKIVRKRAPVSLGNELRHLTTALTSTLVLLLPIGCNSGSGSQVEETTPVKQGVVALDAADAGLQSPTFVTGHVGSASSAEETQQIRSMLGARYKREEVKHSFETIFGETIDCIDYYAQPGAKALVAMGRPVPPLEPKSARGSIISLPDFMFNGKPDRLGRPRSCPDGSVPILQITVDDVLSAGGLDAFNRVHSNKSPPPLPSGVPAIDGKGYAHIAQSFNGDSNITSTMSSMSIFSPRVPSIPEGAHSLSQTWTMTGTGLNSKGCTVGVDCAQSVEAGWVVLPALFPNHGPNDPHLFIYATNDGYFTGCWNDIPTQTQACLPWLTADGVVTPGITLPSGVVGGAQVDMQVVWTVGSAGWCLSVWGIASPQGGSKVGCYPTSDFKGTMQASAAIFQVGGEVYSPNQEWSIPMGSGTLPSAGYGQAAFHHDFAAYVGSNGWSYSFTPWLRTLDQLSYGMSTTNAAGSNWTNWFYFGNEPLIGWAVSSPLLF